MKIYNKLKLSKSLKNEIKRKFQLFKSLGKLHNIIMNIRSSTNHIVEFLKLAGRMISLNNRTRWNSWFLSLIIANKYVSSIDTYIKKHFTELFKNYLTS